MAADVEQVYRYAAPSSVGVRDGRADVQMSTCGGSSARGEDHPRFFDGFVGHAEQMATGLLEVARVARTRYYVPPGMLAAILRRADPVVTSNGDRLRFEKLSACCGVYTRLDLLPDALDRETVDTGTTNVDFNPPIREALAGITGLEPLHLSVGQDLTLTTLDATVIEEKVPLPERWVTGFAEVQAVARTMQPVAELSIVEARRFIRSLPSASGGRTAPLWAVPAGRGLRLSARSGPGAVPLAGPERLRVLEPLLRFAQRLRAYTVEGSGVAASQWELDLADARFIVLLSPDVSRGFSGEGGVLRDLADPRSADDGELVAALLAYEPRIDVAWLGRQSGLSVERVRRALGRLSATGRVGFDAFDGVYFHRELPYDPAALDAMHPRLRDARALVEQGAVRIEDAVARVRSGDTDYVVRASDGGPVCSCPWFAKHRGGRGPCKHVLAVEMERRSSAPWSPTSV